LPVFNYYRFESFLTLLCFVVHELQSLAIDPMIIPNVIDDFEGSSVFFNIVHNGTGLGMALERKDGSNICLFAKYDCIVLITKQTKCTCEKICMYETTLSVLISTILSADHNTTWFCALTFMSECLSQNTYLFTKGTYKIRCHIQIFIHNLYRSYYKKNKMIISWHNKFLIWKCCLYFC
jgi:hypothetical protein